MRACAVCGVLSCRLMSEMQSCAWYCVTVDVDAIKEKQKRKRKVGSYTSTTTTPNLLNKPHRKIKAPGRPAMQLHLRRFCGRGEKATLHFPA